MINSSLVNQICNQYKCENVSEKIFRFLGHLFTPSKDDSPIHSIEHLLKIFDSTIPALKGGGIMGSQLLTQAYLVSVFNFHSYGWTSLYVKQVDKLQSKLNKFVKSAVAGLARHLPVDKNGASTPHLHTRFITNTICTLHKLSLSKNSLFAYLLFQY